MIDDPRVFFLRVEANEFPRYRIYIPSPRILFSTGKMRGESAEERALSLRKNRKTRSLLPKPSMGIHPNDVKGQSKTACVSVWNTRFETYPTSVHIKHFLSQRISSPTLPIE